MPATTLSEAASKLLLAGYGVPVPGERLVVTPEEAVTAAAEIGGPAVVKLCGDRIAHKTERGLVRLGLATPEAVRVAATELLAAAVPADGTVGVLVAPMVRGIRELIAGVHRDDQFGLTVMVGVGGVLAEARADVAFRLVPIDRDDAAEMIDDLGNQALLGPVRGEPAVDRDRLCDVLVGLSDLAMARPDLVAVDVNPLIVSGGVPIVVDALVELDGSA
ncbi:MAG TPA: acetate--CoA ligase family protein [Acidimicrobiales bacterium]|nr:acetate--CoA ligase family protein [Acidimicrobiales bacterium]